MQAPGLTTDTRVSAKMRVKPMAIADVALSAPPAVSGGRKMAPPSRSDLVQPRSMGRTGLRRRTLRPDLAALGDKDRMYAVFHESLLRYLAERPVAPDP